MAHPLSLRSLVLATSALAAACGPAPAPASAPAPAPAPAPASAPASASAPAPASAPATAADPFAFDAAAPLDVKTEAPSREGAATVQALTYASPKGGRVPALLVQPAAAAGKSPAILFQHWGEGDKTEFLDEARSLAADGFVSLLVDAPWLRPEQGKFQMTKSHAYYTQAGIDLLRGVEVLAGLPAVDPARIGYVGHSFGAHLGAVVAARSPRVRALVLMAGTPSLSRMVLESEHPFWKKQRAEDLAGVQALAARMAPLDAELFIARSRVPVFHQFADHDEHITYAMADRYLERTPEPKLSRYYEADHKLNATARDDRRAFLRRLLGEPAAAQAKENVLFGLAPQLTPFAIPSPDPKSFRVQADVVYRKEGERERKLDVYSPSAAAPARGRPAVIVVHGQGHPLAMGDVKRWAVFQGLGQVLAARGYTVVVPNLGISATGAEPSRWFGNVAPVADDVVAALRHVQQNARALGVDPKRVALWVASAGGVYGVPLALGELRKDLRCAVALYPLLDEGVLASTEPPLAPAQRERLSAMAQLRKAPAAAPPLLVVRAGLDRPELNQALDGFVKAAAELEAPVTLARQDQGHHAFDAIDATDETRATLDQIFAFLDKQLGR